MQNTDKFPLDFLIIGTMKSGTSTLSAYLSQHPEIAIPKRELHFFDREFRRGKEWYRQQLLNSANSTTKIFGEKTPFYAWEDKIAEELYNINNKLKLIWLFRDPIDRIISHYKHNLSSGLEWRRIENALQNESKQIKKNLQYGYLEFSKYDLQISRYLKFFPIEQMKFIVFEEFANNQDKILKEVNDFLKVSPQKYAHLDPKNKAKYAKSPFLMYLTRKFFGRDNRIWNTIYSYNTTNKKKEVILKKSTERKLTKILNESVINFSKYTNCSLEYWRNYNAV